ncbi:MAG: exonuclease domain-containing protein, partial [Flavitalea sp.]
GGYASNNDITEIAIVIHDGISVIDRYETLIRPAREIPRYIQALTGITPEMVENAPTFDDVAEDIFEKLKDCIFIAHNVNFDYSFVKHHLQLSGFELNVQKLCTVRLSRKIFPGLTSYSLGKLCAHFGIIIENRHRAGGDADATTILFEHMLRNNGLETVRQFLKKGSKEQYLPQFLPKEEVDKLPFTPGVYYFHNQKGKVIYVGKARNIKYRVRSHFSHNGAGKQRQEFMRNIYSISYESCGTELMAFILESIEIKRLWPQYNSSQKRFTAAYGLYSFPDQNGYLRLAINKKMKNQKALFTFQLLHEGHRLLRRLINDFDLCPKLCYLQTDSGPCLPINSKPCTGACEQVEDALTYNARVEQAEDFLDNHLPTFAVIDDGKDGNEKSCVLIEKGRFYGMGYIPSDAGVTGVAGLKDYLTQYPENDYIRGLVYNYVELKPSKKMLLNAEPSMINADLISNDQDF